MTVPATWVNKGKRMRLRRSRRLEDHRGVPSTFVIMSPYGLIGVLN